jgi:hypothetical protein
MNDIANLVSLHVPEKQRAGLTDAREPRTNCAEIHYGPQD